MLKEDILRSNEFMVIQAAVAAANFVIGAFTIEKDVMQELGNTVMVEKLQAGIDKAKADRKFALSLFEVQKQGNFNTDEDFKKVLDIVHSYNSVIDHSLINSRSAFLPLGAVPSLRFERYQEQ